MIKRNVPWLTVKNVHTGALIRKQVGWGTKCFISIWCEQWGEAGGHIATVLFNHCSNDLSDKLNACSTECMIGSFKVNHLMYADDSGIFGPSSSGLQKRLNVCSSYGLKNDVLYNANKSTLLIVRTKAGVT